MSLEDQIIARLQDHGMFGEDLRAVMELAKAARTIVADPEWWSRDWTRDRCEMNRVQFHVWPNVKRIVRWYVATHNPTATYRTFFED